MENHFYITFDELKHAGLSVVVFLAVAFWIPKLKTLYRCLQCSESSKASRVPLYVRFGYMCIQEFASFWHRYEVHGLENLGDDRSNCVLVGYHSRPTVDIIYAQAFLFPLSSLVSYIFFSIPFAAGPLWASNCIPSSTSTQSSDQVFVDAVVNRDIPLLLCPGGAYECVKRWDQRYCVDWKKVPGFVRVLYDAPSVVAGSEHTSNPMVTCTCRGDGRGRRRRSCSRPQSQSRSQSGRRGRARPVRVGDETRVVPFFTANCEDIFWTTPSLYNRTSDVMRRILEALKIRNGSALLKTALMPLVAPVLAISLGFALLPRPVKLDLYVGRPLVLRATESKAGFARRVRAEMQALMDRDARKRGGRGFNDDLVEADWSRVLGRPAYALYALLQNICFFVGLAVTILLPLAIVLVPVWLYAHA